MRCGGSRLHAGVPVNGPLETDDACVDEVDLTEKTIRDIVEARDPETDLYLPATLKHGLLNRFTVSGLELNQPMTFELGFFRALRSW
jgi:hypothetical protein